MKLQILQKKSDGMTHKLIQHHFYTFFDGLSWMRLMTKTSSDSFSDFFSRKFQIFKHMQTNPTFHPEKLWKNGKSD